MKKLIVQEWLTIDGFAAEKNGELNFFPHSEADKYSDLDQLAFLETIDTVLLGRITYELFVAFWPTATNDQEIIADKLNSLPKLIFSNTLPSAPWGKWPSATVVKGDAANKIRKLKKEDGKDMVLWGSLSLAQSLIKENLVDEYHLRICPTAIGSGRNFFPDANRYFNLELTSFKNYDSGTVLLHYQPK
jgi:dihydrofolate reductase